MTQPKECRIVVGVLALQGAFKEHLQLLRKSFTALERECNESKTSSSRITWECIIVRNADSLAACDALIIPGGESTTIALLATRSGLLEPLRSFVKVQRRPVWGTCAGMILLAEAANNSKLGGQELIGGLDVRVNRNHFGRQIESFETDLTLPFLAEGGRNTDGTHEELEPFRGVFIRAPVVERTLNVREGVQEEEQKKPDTVVAPARAPDEAAPESAVGVDVEVLARLPGRRDMSQKAVELEPMPGEDIVAVRQGNVLATSFHPELTDDARIHVWWLRQVRDRILTARRERGSLLP